jgi:hypothetical protein
MKRDKKIKVKNSKFLEKHLITLIEFAVLILFLIFNIIFIDLFVSKSPTVSNTIAQANYIDFNLFKKMNAIISKKDIYTPTSVVPQISVNNAF